MPAMTVQEFTVKTDDQGNPKKDNFGNTQMMIKFEESAETVYKAVKDPTTMAKGKLMYGTIVEGQYGFKFQADPYNQPGGAPQQPYSPPMPTAKQDEAYDKRSDYLSEMQDLITERLDAIYKAVTGDEWSGTVKDTTTPKEPVVESMDVSDDDLMGDIGF